MSILDDIGSAALDLLKLFAPTVATALGGPLAGVAVKALADALLPGQDAPSAAQVASAVTSLPADQLVKLREIEAKLQADLAASGIKMEELSVKRAEIAVSDTKSARDTSVALGGTYVHWLGSFILCVVFGAVAAMLYGSWQLMTGAAWMDPTTFSAVSGIVGIVLGRLWGYGDQVVSFFFGSSLGSKDKTDAMSAAIGGLSKKST